MKTYSTINVKTNAHHPGQHEHKKTDHKVNSNKTSIKGKTIVFTGGGSAGHVTPNIALIMRLRAEGWKVHYIGSNEGIERQIIGELNIPYYAISSGKLRRYFDLKNFKDPFKVLKGFVQARSIIRKLDPDVVFSKGGFVAVPVVAASKLNKVPTIIHESDLTPGLANKLSIPFASVICVTFPETLRGLPANKAVHTGLPIREQLFTGNAERGFRTYPFVRSKPVLLIMGGSLGSKVINETVREHLEQLTEKFQIFHICGKGNVDDQFRKRSNYIQFEYIQDELPDLLAMSDLVVSRAGATALNEFLALKKPMLLIPLTLKASRGDQLLNAQSFKLSGYAEVLQEEHLTGESLLEAASQVYEEKHEYIARMSKSANINGIDRIADIITKLASQKK